MTTTLRLPEQNQVLLVGRLTRDPELRFTQKGTAVCGFDIAVNRRFKDAASGEWKDDTTFVPVTVWGQTAERCKERLKKGSPVHVEGRLSMDEYTDKQGNKRKNLRVISNRLQILAYAQAGGAGGEQEASPEQSPAPQPEGYDDVPF